jgi:NAD(P)H-flavin reductase
MPVVRLVERAPVGGGVALLTFAVTPEMRASYAQPGQYAEVTLGEDNGFFVIASEVGASTWQFLMRGGGGAADTLLSMEVGGDVTMTSALGEGFPCESARDRALVVAVTGTGIAAARPIVAMRLADGLARALLAMPPRDPAPTEILLGVRYSEDVPLADELERWRALGVRVTVCLSRADPTAAQTHAGGYARGYVQDVLRSRLSPLDAHEPRPSWVVFAVGAAGMVEGVRGVARELGAEVRTNY